MTKQFIVMSLMICWLSGIVSANSENYNEIPQKKQLEPYKNPTLSGLFSSLIPGSGHMYQGKWMKGLFFTASEMALLVASVTTSDSRHGDMTEDNLFNILSNEHFYNVYSAYQDARILNRNKDYKTEISSHTIVDLMTAPFQWEVLKRWTFLLPTAIVGGLVAYFSYRDRKYEAGVRSSEQAWGIPLLSSQATVIGAGEETFFRGFLQPEFTDLFNSEWAGIFTQATLFGLAHYGKATNSEPGKQYENWIPVIFAGVMGIYDGWIAKRNKYDLRENVAGHSWWDGILFIGEYLTYGNTPPFILALSLPLR